MTEGGTHASAAERRKLHGVQSIAAEIPVPLVDRTPHNQLQRPQERHDILLFTPRFLRLLTTNLTVRQGLGLHLHINLRINIRCVQRDVTKPGPDRVDVRVPGTPYIIPFNVNEMGDATPMRHRECYQVRSALTPEIFIVSPLPAVGIEPTRGYSQRILSPQRLRHAWFTQVHLGVTRQPIARCSNFSGSKPHSQPARSTRGHRSRRRLAERLRLGSNGQTRFDR